VFGTLIQIPFTSLNLQQTILLRHWRNRPEVRKWMYCSTPITLQAHLKFIRQLSIRNDCYYFLLQQGQEPLGVGSLTKITSTSAHIGLYRILSRKGIGYLLLTQLIEHAFKKQGLRRLYAEAFEMNTQAMGLYLRVGFFVVVTYEYDRRGMVRLELTKERYENRAI